MAQPRIILFGPPGAGKSSLLGALAASPTLKGKLVEKSGQLEQLQRATYQGKLKSTGELEAYDIRLDGDAKAAATLLDCSGKEASELLQAEQPFAERHEMNRPILDADAVLLTVNAALPTKQLHEQFEQFGRWLNQLHETRGWRLDVGTLPVYLVLTHCDQLARPEDSFSQWMQRIEEGKRKIHDRFRAYLKDQGTAFGSLDVRLWATAIKRPALSDRPAKTEPFGVAELFRESLAAAADFQYRRYTSGRLLQNVTVGLLGLMLMLLLTVAFLFFYQPDQSIRLLDEKVQRLLPRSDKPALRVAGSVSKLEEKLEKLDAVQRDEHFARLPSETQTAVKEHVQELKDYIQLKQESDEAVKLPMHVLRSEKEFEEYEKLAQNFKVPGALADTPLGAYVREAQRQYTRVREEVKAEIDWLHAQEKRAKALYEKGAPLLTSADAKQAEEWIQQYREVRIPRREEGAKLIENKSGVKDITGVTYELLGRFKQVQDARKSWDQERVERLDTMAKLIRAKIPVTD